MPLDEQDNEQDGTPTQGGDNGEEAAEQESQSEGGSVKVPEEFQRRVDALITGANKHQLDYIRTVVMDREHALMKSESKAEKSETFDTEGMPE